MSDLIPLFPLGTPLFPGMVLPLHIFEHRYRDLVRDLVTEAQSGERAAFGVVAIREGHEVGEDAATALADVGCLAELRAVSALPDGRFEIVTTGSRRFAVRQVHSGTASYLQASVAWIDERGGDDPFSIAERARAVFASYRDVAPRPETGADDELPEDPTLLSYALGAAVQLPSRDRQRVLAAVDTTERLQLLVKLMVRERTVLEQFGAVPADGLLRTDVSPN